MIVGEYWSPSESRFCIFRVSGLSLNLNFDLKLFELVIFSGKSEYFCQRKNPCYQIVYQGKKLKTFHFSLDFLLVVSAAVLLSCSFVGSLLSTSRCFLERVHFYHGTNYECI